MNIKEHSAVLSINRISRMWVRDRPCAHDNYRSITITRDAVRVKYRCAIRVITANRIEYKSVKSNIIK